MGTAYIHGVREASEKSHVSKYLSEMREQTLMEDGPRGETFQAEETAHAKALK